MSLSFPDVVNAANEIRSRAKENDAAADSLISQLHVVYSKVEAMKQYHDEIGHLNDLASERPRLALVAGIQQESKHIMDLQQENRELRIALEEQQNAIDLIMSKYRQQISKLVHSKHMDEKLLRSIDTNTRILENNALEINEMKSVMKTAIDADEESLRREEELMASLWKENKGLREMLQISGHYGTYNTKIFGAPTEDKEIQTDTDDSSKLTNNNTNTCISKSS